MSLVFAGRAFIDGTVQRARVRVENGLIVDVAAGKAAAAERVIELDEHQLLVPAGVELLAAMRDWAEAPRDTVEDVTKAALAAGVTVVCDQCNTVPRIDSPELVMRRSEYVAARSYTDFAIATHPPKEPARLGECLRAGAQSVQLFPWDLKPWCEPYDTDDSRATFARIAATGLQAMIFVDELALRSTPLRDVSETYALDALLRRLPAELVARLYVTLPESVDKIVAAKERLPNLSIVVPPFNLLLSERQARERIGIGAFMVPPLRSDEAVAGMRRRAEAGLIDMTMSHHAPHRLSDKFCSDPVPGEFSPKAGYSQIDITYPLMMTKFGVATAVRLCSEAPARHLGLNKGRIAPGYEADLVVFGEDPGWVHENIHVTARTSEIWRVDPIAMFYSRGKVSPFWGERLTYLAQKTFLRGEQVFERGTGSFLRAATRQVAPAVRR